MLHLHRPLSQRCDNIQKHLGALFFATTMARVTAIQVFFFLELLWNIVVPLAALTITEKDMQSSHLSPRFLLNCNSVGGVDLLLIVSLVLTSCL